MTAATSSAGSRPEASPSTTSAAPISGTRRRWCWGERETAIKQSGRSPRATRSSSDSSWFRHYGHRLLAQAALADGWGDPAAWLREAQAFFETNGDDRPAASCRSLLRAAGAAGPASGPRGIARADRLRALGVTSREVDVLVLVGERAVEPRDRRTARAVAAHGRGARRAHAGQDLHAEPLRAGPARPESRSGDQAVRLRVAVPGVPTGSRHPNAVVPTDSDELEPPIVGAWTSEPPRSPTASTSSPPTWPRWTSASTSSCHGRRTAAVPHRDARHVPARVRGRRPGPRRRSSCAGSPSATSRRTSAGR